MGVSNSTLPFSHSRNSGGTKCTFNKPNILSLKRGESLFIFFVYDFANTLRVSGQSGTITNWCQKFKIVWFLDLKLFRDSDITPPKISIFANSREFVEEKSWY